MINIVKAIWPAKFDQKVRFLHLKYISKQQGFNSGFGGQIRSFCVVKHFDFIFYNFFMLVSQFFIMTLFLSIYFCADKKSEKWTGKFYWLFLYFSFQLQDCFWLFGFLQNSLKKSFIYIFINQWTLMILYRWFYSWGCC